MKLKPFNKILSSKKMPKSDREQAVLFGLIELYLKLGKPIGSQTLQEHGFESLSSATIRNYFSKMEERGLLKQPHTSGGRVPTEKAFALYAEVCRLHPSIDPSDELCLEKLFQGAQKEVIATLNRSLDTLSELTGCAVFLSSPRFDQDFICDVKLISLDREKLLSVIVTDFGVIHTEVIYLEREVSSSFLKAVEEYFLWRLSKGEKPFFEDPSQLKMAQRIYNEVMVRHVVGYANFPSADILRGGLSKLLSYPEFNDAASLASSLALLEDETGMQTLLKECIEEGALTTWIGNALCPFVPEDSECAVIAIPYKIHQTVAGAIALLGPMRLSYAHLFGLLECFSTHLSRSLTESIYKHKISFREPTRKDAVSYSEKKSRQIEDQSRQT